jgi:hypothetical protein
MATLIGNVLLDMLYELLPAFDDMAHLCPLVLLDMLSASFLQNIASF